MINYNEYIISDEWDKKRKERLRYDDYTCQICDAKDEILQVHHITYDRLGDELLTDLVSLCVPCHSEIHGRIVEIKTDTEKDEIQSSTKSKNSSSGGCLLILLILILPTLVQLGSLIYLFLPIIFIIIMVISLFTKNK